VSNRDTRTEALFPGSKRRPEEEGELEEKERTSVNLLTSR